MVGWVREECGVEEGPGSVGGCNETNVHTRVRLKQNERSGHVDTRVCDGMVSTLTVLT